MDENYQNLIFGEWVRYVLLNCDDNLPLELVPRCVLRYGAALKVPSKKNFGCFRLLSYIYLKGCWKYNLLGTSLSLGWSVCVIIA